MSEIKDQLLRLFKSGLLIPFETWRMRSGRILIGAGSYNMMEGNELMVCFTGE